MRSLLIKPLAVFLIAAGAFLTFSDEIFAEKQNKCCSTLGACCTCNGPCNAGFFGCECTAIGD